MVNIKKNTFFTILILLVYLIINDFFYNFYFTFKQNYQDRMSYHYGYCNKSGYGFIHHIYEKYKIQQNIKIVNYEEHPSSEWFFYKPGQNIVKNKLIVLNLKNIKELENEIFKSNEIKLHGKNYNIIENKDNCYYLELL